jgi:hypothetical protein
MKIYAYYANNGKEELNVTTKLQRNQKTQEDFKNFLICQHHLA